jgi:TonB family protein
VQFIRDNPKFKGELMINCIVNCKGELVQCRVDNKSGNDELDKQVLAVIKSMTKWTAGVLDGNTVDCSVLFDIHLKKGKISIS